jgi:hypothetical protein
MVERERHVRIDATHRAERRGGSSSPASGSAILSWSIPLGKHRWPVAVGDDLRGALGVQPNQHLIRGHGEPAAVIPPAPIHLSEALILRAADGHDVSEKPNTVAGRRVIRDVAALREIIVGHPQLVLATYQTGVTE